MATVADAPRSGLKVVPKSCPERNQRDRIIEALGSVSHIPRVDEESHSRYYEYLMEHLCFPFTAHYPEPTTSLEEVQYRCTVLELLDPVRFSWWRVRRHFLQDLQRPMRRELAVDRVGSARRQSQLPVY